MADFERIFEENRGFIYKYLFKMCRNHTLAEELTQETFFRAYMNISNLKKEDKASLWLCSIAKNTYFAFYNEQKKLEPLENSVDAESPFDTVDILENKELAQKAFSVLHSLEEPYKEVFMLSVFAADGNEVVSLGGRENFMSEANQKLLRKADIVVTNPPFSMFKEYVDNLIENKKQFLILGNITAITYKNIFSYISSDKMWCGYGFNMMTVFRTPGFRESIASNRSFVKFKGYNPDEGYRKVSGITWFTNLSTSKRNDFYEFTKMYNPEDYYRYDNYDAIDVPRVKDIPYDYEGVMGVPVTFLEVYNPEQFELVGTGKGKQGKSMGIGKNYRGRHDLTYTDKYGKNHCPFGRILIRLKR